jgi:hypothetical protein
VRHQIECAPECLLSCVKYLQLLYFQIFFPYAFGSAVLPFNI